MNQTVLCRSFSTTRYGKNWNHEGFCRGLNGGRDQNSTPALSLHREPQPSSSDQGYIHDEYIVVVEYYINIFNCKNTCISDAVGSSKNQLCGQS